MTIKKDLKQVCLEFGTEPKKLDQEKGFLNEDTKGRFPKPNKGLV